ncbi:MAG: hypothetical protein CMO80_04625 [Verrucomicrobiales bacterium]|nr:hypothetical protein [Verrucomicrobiales bacterium]
MARLMVKFPRSILFLLFVSLLGSDASAAWRPGQQNALTRYLKKEDNSFRWTAGKENGREQLIELTSQTWRDIAWKHQLLLVQPKEIKNPDIVLLLISGSSGPGRYTQILQRIADQAGAVAAVINNVPNQPLFDRKEDALIAYTFSQHIKTGDEDWPALFPMVKSVVKAMDAISQHSKRGGRSVKRFVLTGASKRGWTTWLTGATDRRVAAIAPMVFDILNSKVQTDWARTVWGKQSEQIHDYTDLGLIKEEEDEAMTRIREWVDPYEYRRRFTMPKLILLGLNDPYWVVDSAQHYWNDLSEPKLMYQIPNAGHKLNESEAVRTLAAFYENIVSGAEHPTVRWRVRERDSATREIVVNFDRKPNLIRVWSASSGKRDFRKTKWTPKPLRKPADPKNISIIRKVPQNGYEAVVVEAAFKTASGKTYRVSTKPFVLPLLRGQKVDISNARKPTTEAEKKYWLQNLVGDHGFGPSDVQRATGLNDRQQVAALTKFGITRPKENMSSERPDKLKIRPFPGGWHPRIGFLDGAVYPQRETKISVFTPWDPQSFVVVDAPEAVWSNLGLTYLAHTHVPTIWTEKGIEMKRMEWERHEGGWYEIERELPNGILIGACVKPMKQDVMMELWLKNGTSETLTGMRAQNCVMLKGAPEFSRQSNDNKVIEKPFIACRNDAGNRWVITAWTPNHRPWGNVLCPCMHSDPIFPKAAPGETSRVKGWLTFYEGTDIQGELKRLRKRWEIE